MPRPRAGVDEVSPPEIDPSAGDGLLRIAAIQTACIAISDAAAHLRRTSILVEAASTAALTRALQPGDDDRAWMQALEGAERTMTAAVKTFSETSRAALAVVADTSAKA